MRSIEAVFFDLDGTLAESIEVVYQAYLDFLAGFGKQGSRAEFEEFLGPTLKEILAELKSRYRLPGSLADHESHYLAHVADLYANRVRAKPTVSETLKTLGALGIRIFIVTSSPRDMVMRFLKANHLESFVEGMVTADDCELAKPAPDPYLAALSLAGLEAPAVVAVEDTPNGVLSAAAAGIQVIGIRGTIPAEQLEKAGAEPIIDTIAEILGVISTKEVDWRLINAVDVRFQSAVRRVSFPPDELNLAWEEANRGRALPLFNGQIAFVHRLSGNGAIRVDVDFIDYRTYLATRRRRKIGCESLKTLGVAGLSVVGDHLLLGRRSGSTTTYPNQIETIPAGTLDAQHAKPGDSISLENKIREEFEEETGLSSSFIKNLRPLGLLFDKQESAYDVYFRVAINLSVSEVRLKLIPTPEYSEFILLPVNQVITFFTERHNECSRPTARILWEMMQNHQTFLI